MTEALTVLVSACLVALVRRAFPRIDGPLLVGLSLAVAGGLVSLALSYAPALLAMLPPVVASAIVGAVGSFVAMGGVELLRSFAGRVDIDQRSLVAARQSTTYDVAIRTGEAEAALDRLGAKARETARAVASVGVVTSREP